MFLLKLFVKSVVYIPKQQQKRKGSPALLLRKDSLSGHVHGVRTASEVLLWLRRTSSFDVKY